MMKEELSEQKNNRQMWTIILLSGLMVCLVLGFCNSPKSLYVQPVTQALGISRSVYAINDSCRFVATAVINLFFAPLVVRFGPRKMIAGGFISLIAALTIYSVAEHILLFYLAGALLGIGIAWTTTTMVGYVVNLWCHEKKGTIMGAVLATSGLGAVLGTQTLSPIINREGVFAYRDAFRLAALIVLVTGIVVVLFYRDRPADDTHTKAEEKKESQAESQAYSQLLRRPAFWVALACIFFTGMVLQGIQGVAVPHIRDAGLDAEFAATVLSCQSVVLIATKFSTGWLYDKKGLRFTSGMCMLAGVLAVVVLIPITSAGSGKALGILFAVFSAAAYPLETVMLPIYAQGLFGQKAYHKVLGIFVSANVAGYALGAPVLNLFYDTLGNYRLAFACACALMLVVLVVMQRLVVSMQAQRTEE